MHPNHRDLRLTGCLPDRAPATPRARPTARFRHQPGAAPRARRGIAWLSLALVGAAAGCAGSVRDVTSTYLPRPLASLRSEDEKDIATGDLDRDGRTDIVVCNKKAFGHNDPDGKRAAILLMNEAAGALQDRTALRTDWHDPDKHNDCRDVVIAELTGDDWPEVVFVNTSRQQPRLYRNLGRDDDGRWAGFVDDSARFPTIVPRHVFENGSTAERQLLFCAGGAGDVDGDGDNDLYFGNYDPSLGGNTADVLLINHGDHFVDETFERLRERANSVFVTDAVLLDMDGDGDIDIVKNNAKAGIPPFGGEAATVILYNDGRGDFRTQAWKRLPGAEPYMIAVGRIDEDAYPDVYQVTDGVDVYAFGPDFERLIRVSALTTGYLGGNAHMADLDGDGDMDLGVADIDTNIANCPGAPGASEATVGEFTLFENIGAAAPRFGGEYLISGVGRGSELWKDNVFDFAFVDIDDDGVLDIFMGLCRGYKILLRGNPGAGMER